MTLLQDVYDVFLSTMLDDEWEQWNDEDIKDDLKMLLDNAIPWFKFPRHSLEHDDTSFTDDLSSMEIRILASYMKAEWLSRTILTWENVKPLYEERDFSQANLLDKFRLLLTEVQKQAKKLESIYYRSIDNSPFNYGDLGTKL